MNPTNRSLLRDPELVEMLRDEPELLALADALLATKQRSRSLRRRWRLSPPRRRTVVASVAVAAAAVAVALLLISPWQGSPSFAQRALAAVGSQPVLHVVMEQSATPSASSVDLSTGQTIPRAIRTEVWFDHGRGLKKSVFTIDGKILDEELESDAGSWTRAGPVYTCAWIAGHPVEATKAGVSCNANGDNGTTPRTVPERAPELDPALGGFVDRYQSALASGQARRTGVGQIEGHDVVWLQFEADGTTEQVAVDAQSYKPVLIRETRGALSIRVLTAETLPYEAAFFSKPPKIEAQSGGSVASATAVDPQQAAAILGGHALWLGQSWNDLRLVGTTHEERTIGYGLGLAPGRADVIDFTYSPVAADGTVDQQSEIHLYESTACVLSVGWTCTAQDPAGAGTIQLRGPISLLRRDGLFVAIWDWSPQEQRSLEIARALGLLGTVR